MIQKGPLGTESAIDQDRELAALLDEEAAFEKLRPSLRADERYRDKFVAVLRHAVVDCDLDKFRLVRRISTLFPNDVLFVAHVQQDEPPVDLPSPEIES